MFRQIAELTPCFRSRNSIFLTDQNRGRERTVSLRGKSAIFLVSVFSKRGKLNNIIQMILRSSRFSPVWYYSRPSKTRRTHHRRGSAAASRWIKLRARPRRECVDIIMRIFFSRECLSHRRDDADGWSDRIYRAEARDSLSHTCSTWMQCAQYSFSWR